jgi:glucokinase
MTTLSRPPCLIADVGGTNARFALTDNSGDFFSARTLPCADYPGLIEAIRDYLTQASDQVVENTAIAIATPVSGDQVRMTNHHWSFSIEEVRQALGLQKLLVLNDFSALAMSLPYLAEAQLKRIDRRGDLRHGVKAVIGPGTGFGVAGLVPTEAGWQPIATEGGHVTFSPADPLETEILMLLWEEYAHVSVERLVSGPGIALLYRTLCKIDGTEPLTDDTATIVQLAASGTCETAKRTLNVFSGLLGTIAGNIALTFGCVGGLYLGGGVIAKLGGQFDIVKFNERFIAKGRFAEYLQAIPVNLITAEHPAFIGAAQHLKNHL